MVRSAPICRMVTPMRLRRSLCGLMVAMVAAGCGKRAVSDTNSEGVGGSGAVAAATVPKVRIEHLKLLSSELQFTAQTTVAGMDAYVKSVKREADQTFATVASTFSLLLAFTCSPTSVELKVAIDGEAPSALLKQFHDRVVQLPRLPVQNAPVSFELQLDITE